MLNKDRIKKSERKKRLLVIIMASVIVLSMVISIFAVYIDNTTNSNKITYGEQEFTITNQGQYQTTIDGKKMVFSTYPQDIERINLSRDIADEINNSQYIIFLFDPMQDDQTLSYIDYIRYELETQSPKPMGFATISASDKYTLPVLTCKNATFGVTFILINSSETTEFTRTEGCILMNGQYRELIAEKDRLIYSLYGIMQ